MGSSPVGVNTMAKFFQVKTLKHECKNDMVANTFCEGSSSQVKFIGQLQTFGQET
jgi:hypothetical protein